MRIDWNRAGRLADIPYKGYIQLDRSHSCYSDRLSPAGRTVRTRHKDDNLILRAFERKRVCSLNPGDHPMDINTGTKTEAPANLVQESQSE